MPEFETVKVVVEDGIGRLTLDRQDSLNAFNEKMTSEIQSVLKSFSADQNIRCVAITGNGRAFSAGQDLKEVRPGTSFAESLKRRYNPIISQITGMEKPVVALVNGVAAGAGMSLALACDFKVMSSSAKLIQAFVKIGLVPDSGSSYFLPRLVGYTKAFELATLGSEVSAEEALRLGVVNRVFPDEDFAEESGKILKYFANGPTKAYSLIKRMLKHSSTSSLEESLEYEAYMQEIAGRTEDAREATRAFVEKRPPSYRGK
ncbi:MAG TPA: enoyl-CoA hydratase-related protein [Candidatus Kryptobacter bacterium]|nr:enoyl-CoA hydratase-related protein [Candidatus Kryptobacter bacterium]